jgi:hypothetical protein
MIMQLLAGANLVEVDFGLKEDRALFGGAQKREIACFWKPSAMKRQLTTLSRVLQSSPS